MGRPRVAGLLAAAAAAAAIGACGSGAGAGTGSGTTARTASPSTTPAAPTTTTVTPTAPTVTAAGGSSTSATGTIAPSARAGVGSRGCTAGQVSVSVGASTAGLGHLGEPLLFENVGSAACALRGYPGAAVVGQAGRQVQIRRTPNGYLGGLSPQATADPVVLLRPHQTASALLEGEDSTPAGASCPRYAALLVTPPNSTLTSRVARALSICDPQIHPVVPGSTGTER
jgi:Protein of unknown function (DUF4232)